MSSRPSSEANWGLVCANFFITPSLETAEPGAHKFWGKHIRRYFANAVTASTVAGTRYLSFSGSFRAQRRRLSCTDTAGKSKSHFRRRRVVQVRMIGSIEGGTTASDRSGAPRRFSPFSAYLNDSPELLLFAFVHNCEKPSQRNSQ